MAELVDLGIIGSGPAGLTAALFAARAGLETVVFEKEGVGGQPANVEVVENYPGFDSPLSGAELSGRMLSQAVSRGARLEIAEVEEVRVGTPSVLRTGAGDFRCRALLIASGARPRKLDVPGEEALSQRGVFYCAACEGAGYRDRRVAVVGGGDSALSEALYLARLASKVLVVHRREAFRAGKPLQEKVGAHPGIEVLLGRRVESIEGERSVAALRMRGAAGQQEQLAVEGVLVAVGREPNTLFLGGSVRLDPGGGVLVNERMETSARGVFAAGDVRTGSPRQIATAVGDGATAALSAIHYLL